MSNRDTLWMVIGALAGCSLVARAQAKSDIVPLQVDDQAWIKLFNGTDLSGWRPNVHPESWSVKDVYYRNIRINRL